METKMYFMHGVWKYDKNFNEKSFLYRHVLVTEREKANLLKESIVECAPSKLELMLKEAMHIKWKNPTLNKQLKHAAGLNSLVLIFFFK